MTSPSMVTFNFRCRGLNPYVFGEDLIVIRCSLEVFPEEHSR
jgi:hypothetical protein